VEIVDGKSAAVSDTGAVPGGARGPGAGVQG